MTIRAAHNKVLPKAGVSCFNESEVLNPSIMHLMKLVLKSPAFAKRQTVMRHFKRAYD